ncbi:MAG TPA: HAMP domain-containing sensor histidine kinase [Acidimicrobiales bacterium]|nr:HAMP domain-containing sensor histidine kinase [Acidimicrobiales bacterium]
MTLRLRLYIAAAVLLSVVALLGVLLVRSVEHSELQQIDQQLKTAAPVVGVFDRPSAGQAPDATLIRPPTSAQNPASSNRISEFYIAVVKGTKRDVLFTPLDGQGSVPQLPVATTSTGHPVTVSTVGSQSGSERWRAILITSPNQPTKLLVAASLAQVDATASRLRLAAIGAGIIVLGVLLAAGFWVGRLGLRPIAEVTDVADAIAAGNRSRRVVGANGKTEAAHLARAINVMLDEQQAAETRLRQFIADASHELRTPVSVILGISDLWRQGALRAGDASDDAMRRIGQSGRRMGGLVEDLLLLAHLDDGRTIELECVDLEPLLHDAIHDASATDPLRNITLEVTGRVVVMGDEAALRQVIANLITNSLRHTPSQATITIRAIAVGNRVTVDVVDSGPGMTPDEAGKAFDRFWRADASRTRSGTGLGLAIVAGIVAAHHGTVTIDSGRDRGTTVTVRLPSA